MSRKTGERRRPRARPSRRLHRPRWLRLVVPVAVLGAVGFLYSQPIATYLDTRDAVERRTREVTQLRAERALLARRLESSATLETLAREARRTGLVRPAEQLFIVKGIPAWQRRHAPDR